MIEFSNWPEYIDVKGKRMPSLEMFEDASGIDVNYTPDVNDNNEFFAKISNQLGDCQPIGRDIMTLTDWMAARLVNLGWLQKLDHAQHPERRQQPRREPQEPRLGPEPRLLACRGRAA